jgi:hypothetical protein
MSGIRNIHFTDRTAGIIFTPNQRAERFHQRSAYKSVNTEGGNIMAVGIGVIAVSAIISYEIEKRLPSVKKN